MLDHAVRTLWMYLCTLKETFPQKISKIGFSTIWQILQRFAILSERSKASKSIEMVDKQL